MALNTKEYQFNCKALYKIWKIFGFKGLWYIIEALTSRERSQDKKNIWRKHYFGPYILRSRSIWSLYFDSNQFGPCYF